MLIDDIEYVIFRHADPAAAARQFMLDYGCPFLGLCTLSEGGLSTVTDVAHQRLCRGP